MAASCRLYFIVQLNADRARVETERGEVLLGSGSFEGRAAGLPGFLRPTLRLSSSASASAVAFAPRLGLELGLGVRS
jgi:hypothetical protein